MTNVQTPNGARAQQQQSTQQHNNQTIHVNICRAAIKDTANVDIIAQITTVIMMMMMMMRVSQLCANQQQTKMMIAQKSIPSRGYNCACGTLLNVIQNDALALDWLEEESFGQCL
jgi:hypothetical protein